MIKTSLNRRLLLAACALTAVIFGESALAVERFEASYGNGPLCALPYTVKGMEPSESGKYPLFIYVAGTWENYENATARAAVEEMAKRGHVAVTLEYPNNSFGDCSQLSAKASCMFDPSRAASAVANLCERDKADCRKGIVVAGFSQGSIMAILAKNYDYRVRAAYGIGAGVQYGFDEDLAYDLRACMADGNRALSSTRLRVVNGEADGFMGSRAETVRKQLEELTGYSCGNDATSCAGEKQSGWHMVQHHEVEDGVAEHCYMRVGGCGVNQEYLDSHWRYGSADWSLITNLEWLTRFTEQK